MNQESGSDIVISGIGVTSAIGQGKPAFISALLEGRHAFGVMSRPERQHNTAFIGAEIDALSIPAHFSRKHVSHASFSGQVALVTLHEAWQEAQLARVDPERIGLVIGGSNFQQRSIIESYTRYWNNPQFIRPNHGVAYMDTDVGGLCSQEFGIRGLTYTVGGASASGHLAVLQAIQAVQSGQVDVCIALGALMDLSHFECQALRSLGAMGSDRFSDRPDQACRPFDEDHDGFIFGENCAAVVVERMHHARARCVPPYGVISGWSMAMDANRNPNPSAETEVKVIQRALAMAGAAPTDIDYVNPHGTASRLGDQIELSALSRCTLTHARINTTKSITGHGLSAAGTVEVVATLLQMQAARLHPSRNLHKPMDATFNWVHEESIDHDMHHALNLSFGFGGINTAICLKRCEP